MFAETDVAVSISIQPTRSGSVRYAAYWPFAERNSMSARCQLSEPRAELFVQTRFGLVGSRIDTAQQSVSANIQRVLGPGAGGRIKTPELVDVVKRRPDEVVLEVRFREIDAGIFARRVNSVMLSVL